MPPDLPYSHMLRTFRSDDDTLTSLFSQRKHRKRLKDGSGMVWPASVEDIFVRGLYKYWELQCATSRPRGRHRWRNHFLVGYLKENGVDRTKTQVASHMQVLLKLWKGKPEFHLIAGGEERSSEQIRAIVNAEGQLNQAALNLDDAGHSSGGTLFLPSPGMRLGAFSSDNHTALRNHVGEGITVPYHGSPVTLSLVPTNLGEASRLGSMTNFDHFCSDLASANQCSQGFISTQTPYHTCQNQLHLTALNFTVDGADPSQVRLDDLISIKNLAPLTPLTLEIKLGTSQTTSSATAANFSCPSPTYFMKCSTKMFINGQMQTEKEVALALSASADGDLTTVLPSAWLDQSEWLELSLAIVVTQEIIANDQTLLFVIYVFDLTADSASPQLLDFWKFDHDHRVAAAELSLPSPHSGQQALSAYPSFLQSAHESSMPNINIPSPEEGVDEEPNCAPMTPSVHYTGISACYS